MRPRARVGAGGGRLLGGGDEDRAQHAEQLPDGVEARRGRRVAGLQGQTAEPVGADLLDERLRVDRVVGVCAHARDHLSDVARAGRRAQTLRGGHEPTHQCAVDQRRVARHPHGRHPVGEPEATRHGGAHRARARRAAVRHGHVGQGEERAAAPPTDRLELVEDASVRVAEAHPAGQSHLVGPQPAGRTEGPRRVRHVGGLDERHRVPELERVPLALQRGYPALGDLERDGIRPQ